MTPPRMAGILLPLALALLDVALTARTANRDLDLEPEPRAPAHLRLLAARGGDLDAFTAAVEANEQRAAALLDTSEELAAPASWPDKWKGKFGKARVVGSGSYGKVYLAPVKCSSEGETGEVAVKRLRVTQEAVEAEVSLMRAVAGHPNVVEFFDWGEASKGPKAYFIMMEAAGGGDLGDYLGSGSTPALFLGMLRGMKELHDRGLVHRDLKPANVMVSRKCGGEEPCTAKIGDLGLACSTGTRIPGVPPCESELAGTPLFLAPETLRAKTVDPQNDVWAMGMILYELTFSVLPFQLETAQTIKALYQNIVVFDITKDRNYKKLPDGEMKALLGGMLQLDENQRISSTQALEIATAWGERLGFADAATGVVSVLPACFFEEPDPSEEVDATEDSGAGDIDFFVIRKPIGDSATMIFNEALVGKDGTVTEQITRNKKYLGTAKVLQPGDTVLDVNGKAWAKVLAEEALLARMKGGMDGALVFKYRKKA